MTNEEPISPIKINGWYILAHPEFLDQAEQLMSAVAKHKEKYPDTYRTKNNAKRLFALFTLAFEEIPRNPESADYRQGRTLGEAHKHWMRAKFYQQYRLFFRYRAAEKIIVYGWVNDEDTLRAYGSNTDAYNVFKKMLGKGKPPTDWKSLVAQAKAAVSRLNQFRKDAP